MKITKTTIKALNARMLDLLAGHKVRIGGFYYWINFFNHTVYALSVEAFITGVIDGYPVAHVDQDWTKVIK